MSVQVFEDLDNIRLIDIVRECHRTTSFLGNQAFDHDNTRAFHYNESIGNENNRMSTKLNEQTAPIFMRGILSNESSLKYRVTHLLTISRTATPLPDPLPIPYGWLVRKLRPRLSSITLGKTIVELCH